MSLSVDEEIKLYQIDPNLISATANAIEDNLISSDVDNICVFMLRRTDFAFWLMHIVNPGNRLRNVIVIYLNLLYNNQLVVTC